MEGLTLAGESVRDRAELRRRKIIDAARILFIGNGFHATGVAQIAKLSGVAVGQLYRDFEAKEDIVAEIVEGDSAKFMARESLHRAIAAGDVAAVWAWLRLFIEPDEKTMTEQLFAEIIAESARNARIAAIFARTQEEVQRTLLDALALLAPGDHLADRRAILADLVLTQSLGLMQYRLIRPTLDAERLGGTILRLITREIELMQAVAIDR